MSRVRLLWYFSTWAYTHAESKAEAERWIRLFLNRSLARSLGRQFKAWLPNENREFKK
jgi:hypothetical protein